MNQKGLTLIELLVVIVIIGLISLIGIPALRTILSDSNQNLVEQESRVIEHSADMVCIELQCVDDLDITDDVIRYYDGPASNINVLVTEDGYHIQFDYLDYHYDSQATPMISEGGG